MAPVPPSSSPLGVVTDDPLLHQFVGYLQDAQRQLEGTGSVELVFHRSRIDEVAHAFHRMIRRGEERLHRLARLLADTLYEGRHDLRSVVVGEDRGNGERFVLHQPLTVSRLYGLTDLDLGQRLLGRVQLEGAEGWRSPRLIASAVEYLPVEENPWAAHKMISRIKAEEEIWDKVVDEIFHLDHLVQRDKQLRRLSRYVKDVFGLKIVVGSVSDAPRLHRHLANLTWTEEDLRAHRVPAGANTERLEVLETKDYLSRAGRKRSGFMAMKSVVRWWDRTFEIQVQPLRNYYRERERITKESHAAHAERRDALRAEVAKLFPLMGFYRAVLVWLFSGTQGAPPSHPGVTLRLEG
ncbi:MAG: hypothetical protein KDA24_18430 [Deltaproteobacteria bacterium]|nr:hypothetical protein [Deltaproteobacteria bacterium]